MNAHTPGPWTFRRWASEPVTIAGKHFEGVRALTNDGKAPVMADGVLVAQVVGHSDYKRGEGHQLECPERDANAERIVACVNALEGIANPAAYVAAMAELIAADIALNAAEDFAARHPVESSHHDDAQDACAMARTRRAAALTACGVQS